MAATVRNATLADLPAILDLSPELRADTAALYDPEERLSDAEAERIFQAIDASPAQFLLVAEVDNQVVGTVAFFLIPSLTHEGRPSGVLENMVVSANFRRHGVGAALVREVDRIAREHHAVKVSLTSNAVRRAAHRFYEAQGWRRSHAGYTLSYAPAQPR